jgi:hypothetical protein
MKAANARIIWSHCRLSSSAQNNVMTGSFTHSRLSSAASRLVFRYSAHSSL